MRLRNREVFSLPTEQCKGRPEIKQTHLPLGKLLSLSPHLENENINHPKVMVINSTLMCAKCVYFLAYALWRTKPVSLELLHSLNIDSYLSSVVWLLSTLSKNSSFNFLYLGKHYFAIMEIIRNFGASHKQFWN